MDKFFSKDIEGKVTYSAVKNDKIFEATIYLPNSTILRAEESTNDMYTSIDIVLDNLERQIRKNKTKLQKKYQALETIRFEKIAEPCLLYTSNSYMDRLYSVSDNFWYSLQY